jgi:hypothetical protein
MVEMTGIVYEDDRRIHMSAQLQGALRALGVGYQHIQPMHAALLRSSYGFCYRGKDGYEITALGRSCLKTWGEGGAFDCKTNSRRPDPEADGKADHVSDAG